VHASVVPPLVPDVPPLVVPDVPPLVVPDVPPLVVPDVPPLLVPLPEVPPLAASGDPLDAPVACGAPRTSDVSAPPHAMIKAAVPSAAVANKR